MSEENKSSSSTSNNSGGKKERGEHQERNATTKCGRCGSSFMINWKTGMCSKCDRAIEDVDLLMHTNRNTMPMSDAELDAIVAKEGRIRGDWRS